ncbi:MAG: sensor histidine kinase, partial [Alphaproteobacteria bacterium]|nr:sensor histidine kinase [Alphaproteobacteria bacterium]
VLLSEVIDHVALPLIPLSGLLLIFSVLAVRRALQPLAKAIRQIDELDPRAIEQRLEIPNSPREVNHMVTAMNAALGRIESAILSLREFTADVAHELRTPLAIMTIEVERLSAGPGKVKLKHDLDGMTRIVSQMLDMAYANALIIPEQCMANLTQVASDVIALLTPLALKAQRGIVLHVESDVVEINGHAEAIGRALRNIIENALVHTPPHTCVEVTVKNNAQIVVRDYGAGIPDEQRGASLNRFWQGPRKKHQGAGLGLAIAMRIANAHNGTITIGAAQGCGAEVTLMLRDKT